jgi:hypothetical protein
MIELILQKQGSHENTLEEIAQFRNTLNVICSKAAWLAYSVDGVAPPAPPNPASNCQTMNCVRRPTLDPVFVAVGETLDIEPRGALVGLHPFQLRQLYALMLGARLVDAGAPNGRPTPLVKEVQVVRNEGGLMLRESSCALILQSDGSKRSDKAIAPTQTESDQAAYGSRKAKVYGASFQVEAWDANSLLVAPLCCAIEPPASREWRSMGEFGDPSWLRSYLEKQHQQQRYLHADEAISRRKLEDASGSMLTDRALAARDLG